MAAVKVGDRISVIDREPLPADTKNGLFYNYFRGLTGVVERVYDDNTVCVDVDIDGLPEEVLARHKGMEETARDKWINGLSQEQRNKLTEADKQFRMHYKVVVSSDDVTPSNTRPGKGKAARSASKSDTPVPRIGSVTTSDEPVAPPEAKVPAGERPAKAERAAESPEASASPREAASAPPDKPKAEPARHSQTAGDTTEPPKRLTEKDLAAREREFLKSLKAQRGDEKAPGARSG